MPKYLAGLKAICMECIPANFLPIVLDGLMKNNFMSKIPNAGRKLMGLGLKLPKALQLPRKSQHMPASKDIMSSLDENYQNRSYNEGHIGCTDSMTRDEVISGGKSGMVAVAERMASLYSGEVGKFRKKGNYTYSAGESTKKNSLRSSQFQDFANQLDKETDKKETLFKSSIPLRAMKEKANVYFSYKESDDYIPTRIRRSSMIHLLQNDASDDTVGDVWNQLQTNEQWLKERNEMPFSGPKYPASLNPKRTMATPSKCVHKEDDLRNILLCMMKCPKRRIDTKLYVDGLVADSSLTHLPATVTFRKKLSETGAKQNGLSTEKSKKVPPKQQTHNLKEPTVKKQSNPGTNLNDILRENAILEGMQYSTPNRSRGVSWKSTLRNKNNANPIADSNVNSATQKLKSILKQQNSSCDKINRSVKFKTCSKKNIHERNHLSAANNDENKSAIEGAMRTNARKPIRSEYMHNFPQSQLKREPPRIRDGIKRLLHDNPGLEEFIETSLRELSLRETKRGDAVSSHVIPTYEKEIIPKWQMCSSKFYETSKSYCW